MTFYTTGGRWYYWARDSAMWVLDNEYWANISTGEADLWDMYQHG